MLIQSELNHLDPHWSGFDNSNTTSQHANLDFLIASRTKRPKTKAASILRQSQGNSAFDSGII